MMGLYALVLGTKGRWEVPGIEVYFSVIIFLRFQGRESGGTLLPNNGLQGGAVPLYQARERYTGQ